MRAWGRGGSSSCPCVLPFPLSHTHPSCPNDTQTFLADILSVLAMSYGAEGARESLHYRFKGTPNTAGSWGHEYIR